MPNTQKPARLESAVFGSGSKLTCVWDWGLRKRNLDFLRSTDHGYFTYLARVHDNEMAGPDRARAATALRASYHHGLETFFMFLGAALQAPHCVPAWMLKTEPGILRDLVADIDEQKKTIRNLLGIDKVSWATIAHALIHWNQEDATENARVQGLFGELWGRFAKDYLKDHHRLEYNSYKHGRSSSVTSGLTIKVANPAPGGGPPQDPDAWLPLGLPSKFATRFMLLRPIEGAPKKGDDPHCRFVDQVINWSPDAMAQALQLISTSVLNVASGIRVRLGNAEGEDLTFGCPSDEADFLKPWTDGPGVETLTKELHITEAHITRYSQRELGQRLKKLQGR